MLCQPRTGSRLFIEVDPYTIGHDNQPVDEWVKNWVARDYPGWGVPVDLEGKIIYDRRPPESERGPGIWK